MYVGKMFNINGTLCKILNVFHQNNMIIYDCVNYQNGERFLMDGNKNIVK